jgi:hypothetical protein
MNGNVKCVDKPSRNNECMHVKCKCVVIVMWNNSTRFKFYFYHLVTILWGKKIVFFYSNEEVFNIYCYTIDESVKSVKTKCVIFQFKI